MAKSKNKKNERIINVGYQYSKEELTKINAEAYYLAIKRLEEEKQKIEENKPDSQTNKLNKKESIKRTLLLLMLPTKAYKKDSTNKKTTDETLNINIVDSLISSFVAFVWRTFGILLRFFSIAIGFIFFKNKPILLNGFAERIVIVVFVILLFVAYAFGCIFEYASKDIEHETNRSSIYAYNASFLSIIAIILSLIKFIKD